MEPNRILIVDDDPIVLKSSVKYLEAKNRLVTSAGNGEEALKLLEKARYDLVITDLVMDDADGIDILKKAKKLNPDIAVIILTGYADFTSAIEAIKYKADDYLVKPCAPETLSFKAESCFKKAELKQKILKQSLELAETNKSLIKEAKNRKKATEKLQKSEQKYKAIFENANDLIINLLPDGKIIDINKKARIFIGHNPQDIVGKKFYDIIKFSPEDTKRVSNHFESLFLGGHSKLLDIEVIHKDGHKIYTEASPAVIMDDGNISYIQLSIRDISKRLQAENLVKKHMNHLDEMVQERTRRIEKTNTALEILLKKREKDKSELENNMLQNAKKLIMPYIDKLLNSELDKHQQSLVNLILFNIDNIITPLVRELSSDYFNFTPSEILIANLVREGKSSNEIAELSNLSNKTIETHRKNIRKKMGITNRKANLKTYLQSFQ